MKASKKLYKALVYRGPLQPRPVNHLVTNQIQKNCLLMYLKQSEMQYSGRQQSRFSTQANLFNVYQRVIYKKKVLQLIPRFTLLRDT